MPPPPPKVVSFDAAGTLVHLAEPVGDTYARVAAAHGIEAAPASVARAFASVWRRTPAPFSDGSPPDSDERSWWRRLVREVFVEAGCPVEDGALYARLFDDLYRRYEEPGAWIAAPDARAVLARVSRSRPCVVLSNFDARLRRILRDLGLAGYFEALFLSCEQGLSKPDPRLFLRVAEAFGVAPSEILHVGDDPVCDWAGAERAGLRHFRVGPGQRGLRELPEELSLA